MLFRSGLRQGVIAVEFPEGAVELVAAALGEHVDVAAGGAAGFGGVVGGFDLELGEGVDGGGEGVGHGVVVHDFDAVEEEAVGGVAGAVGGEAGGAEGAIGLADGAAAAADGDGTD